MGNRLKLDIENYKELSVEIKDASVTLDPDYLQCWCLKLEVHWQTMKIDGWGFLSGRWGELIFHKEYDGQPPHFISGVPIETDSENEMLWKFAEDIGLHPSDVANSIFRTLGKVMYMFQPVRLVSDDITTYAISYRYETDVHKIQRGE